MKRLVLLVVLLLAHVKSLNGQKNEKLNFENNDKPQHRWVMVPDTNGRMHLVDLNAYKPPIGPMFDAEKEVKFILTTRRHGPREINMTSESLQMSRFGKNHPTRITIHGWQGDLTSKVNWRVTEEYLRRGDFNCISVDWSKGAGTYDYIAASYRVTDVAKFTAKLIDFLQERGFVRFQTLHVIGHSLGGHAAGLVGKFVKNGRVQAIFGLDPAGPLFDVNKPDERIAATDGVYVEIMHTNGYTLGLGAPLGQADFFPNFGRSQPGCGIDLTGSCAHGRAPEYFAESINSSKFIAKRCQTSQEIENNRCTVHGAEEIIMRPEPANYELRGYFYLSTNAYTPFARG